MELQVTLEPGAIKPEYAHATDAGMDLFSNTDDVVLGPGARALIPTGVSVAVPIGFVGLIMDKSGLALKQGLSVLGGVIDSGYRGEINVILLNTSAETITIQAKQKVAQMLIQPVHQATIYEVDELPEAGDMRGKGGFGSTGV